jgi:hypothetical protein
MVVADAETRARLLALWDRPHTVWGWFATVDHKEIGKRYLVTAFAFLLTPSRCRRRLLPRLAVGR